MTLLFAAACSPQETSATDEPPTAPALVGDASQGETLFRQGRGDAPPCITCHQVGDGSFGFSLGPNLVGVLERAATRIEGLSAEEYLIQSIISPSAFIVPGFRSLMFSRFGELYSDQDMADLLAYLTTL
jgi:cytochrome c